MTADEVLNKIEEVEIVPDKPDKMELKYFDSIKDQIEIEYKYDGYRMIVFKDPDSGYYKCLSSSGNPLRGNFQNLFKQLGPALNAGYLFSGEGLDIQNPESRSAAASIVTTGGQKFPADRILFMVWNCFKITPDMIVNGKVNPDAPEFNLPYKAMRLKLLDILRKLKPTQVKATKRYKMGKNATPSSIFDKITGGGGEGVVGKYKSGGRGYIKHKMVLDTVVYPLVSFNISTSTSKSGLVSSVSVIRSDGREFNVGGGYSDDKMARLTDIAKMRNFKPEGLYVGVSGGRPADPGGLPHVPQFKFLSTDPDGNSKILEFYNRNAKYITDILEGMSIR